MSKELIWIIAKLCCTFFFSPSCYHIMYQFYRLEKMGALDVNEVVHGHQGWRLVTCAWLRAGVVRILANMLSLLFIGIRLEQEFGFPRIGLLYIISGLGGSLLSALFIQSSISVGASGALFGLLGGILSELITNWSIYANKLAALLTLVFIIVMLASSHMWTTLLILEVLSLDFFLALYY